MVTGNVRTVTTARKVSAVSWSSTIYKIRALLNKLPGNSSSFFPYPSAWFFSLLVFAVNQGCLCRHSISLRENRTAGINIFREEGRETKTDLKILSHIFSNGMRSTLIFREKKTMKIDMRVLMRIWKTWLKKRVRDCNVTFIYIHIYILQNINHMQRWKEDCWNNFRLIEILLVRVRKQQSVKIIIKFSCKDQLFYIYVEEYIEKNEKREINVKKYRFCMWKIKQ